MALSIREMLAGALSLFRHGGGMLTLELVAVGIGTDTAVLLLNPGLARTILGEGDATVSAGLVAYLVVSSLTLTVWASLAIRRLWDERTTGRSDGGDAVRALLPVLVPLLAINLAVDVVGIAMMLLFLPLIAVVSAVTCMILPVAMIEGTGWGAPERAWSLVRPEFGPVLVIWLLWLGPALLLAGLAAPAIPPVDPDAAGLSALVITAVGDLPYAAISAFSLCLNVVLYGALRRGR